MTDHVHLSIKPEIISYSEVFKWDTCPRQYWYRFGLGLRPQNESGAIDTGVKGHKLLQHFYNLLELGHSKDEAVRLTQQEASKMVKAEAISEIGSLLKAWTLVDNYIRGNDFNSKAVLVENRFLIPIEKIAPEDLIDLYDLQNVQIGFTPDVVFEHTGGFCEVEDAKFVGRAWSKSKLNRFQQSKLYQIFLNRMGYNVTRSSVRFFNVTTGLVKPQDYTLSSAEEENLISDFTRAVGEVFEYRRSPESSKQYTRRTMNYTTCQFCAFEFPCTLEAEGKDASKTLKHEYTKSDYDYNR